MPKKITIPGNNLLGNLSDDWGGVNNGQHPITIHETSVSPGAEWGINRGEIERFIKEMFGTKAGEFYFDSNTSKYLVFADSENRDLYLSNREEHADLLVGTFDAPANYTAEIMMATPSSNIILKGTTGNYIDFSFDVKTRTGSSTGEAVIASFSFNNAGNIIKETRIYEAGTNVHFLVDDYLSTGTNSISVTITGRNTLVSSMAAVTYTVVNLELSSNFAFSTPINKGSYLHIPYTLKGSNVKYLEWYLDGERLPDVDTVVGLNVNGTKNLDTSSFAVGKHNIQARAFITESGTNYYSNTLYFDFLVCPSNGIWPNNITSILLGVIITEPLTSGTLSIDVKQYETFNYKIAVYDSRSRILNLVITDNGVTVKSITVSDTDIINESYSPITVGNHAILFTCDGETATFTAVAQASDIGISEETSDLLLRLSAKGRSNNETNPATWTFQQDQEQGGRTIGTSFSGFAWNAKSGWNNDALLIPAGANINIGLNPLSGNPIIKGRTIEIDFETSRVEDDTASVVSLLNGSTGLSVTASTARLQTAGGTKVETKFRDGDRIRLSFIINRTDDSDNLRMLYIVNNGILERASQFAANDAINVPGNALVIGSTGCDIKLYSINVYDKALPVDQAFQNYAVNNPNIVSIASFNDIYDNNGAISVDKVNSHIPVMIITGDISSIMSISDKSHKNDWNSDPVDIEFRNMQNPEMNFFLDEADIRLQGTSSISYPRKNFRIYSKSKSKKYQTKLYTPTHNEEDLVSNGKYAFKDKSAPVTCWCLKADFAESSGSHNTGVARLWNSVMKNVVSGNDHILQTEAQKWAVQNEYEYDVRTTIDGFPIVLFQRDSVNSPLICLGQYNFNNDKSTEDVFGFTALSKEGATPFDNSHVECWEVLDSDNSIALFTDISDFDNSWDNAFEARYPDKNKNVTALKSVCQFLNSCYNSSNETVNVTTWRAGKADHFDLNKLAAYYVYLLRFGAADQTVKNAMFTTEDGEHWFYINYDNDTVLGIDNESKQFDTWDYGLFTRTPNGGYYYAGKGKSVLWRLFEADSECMALARQIDALLFNAGLTYEKVLEMFDDSQSGQWCERIYNENGRYKYISQALVGMNVLHMLQGSRKSHRHWWLQRRFEKYDNVFGNGTYSIRSIQARSTGTVNIPRGAAYKFTPAVTTYFGYAVASTTVDAPTERTAGTEYTATGLPQETGVGNLIYIYNANNIGAIDLSAYISALGSLNIGDAIDVNGNSHLTKLVLGDGTHTNSYLSAISGLSAVKSLEEIDIRGYQSITNIDLSELLNLNTFKASESGLTSFAPANGVTLTNVVLPDTIQSIVLNRTNVTAIDYTPTTSLRSVELRNITGSWSTKTFVNSWLELLSDEQLSQASLTLTGINWTNMTVEQVLRFAKIGTRTLQGKMTLASLNYSQYQQILETYGSNVFDPNGTFIIDAPSGIYFEAPASVTEGQSVTLNAIAFPIDNSIVYHLYNSSGSEIYPVNDIATHNGVTLNVNTGVLTVGTINEDFNIKLRAVSSESVSELQTCSIHNIASIEGFTISGTTLFTEAETHQLTIVPTNSNYNVPIESIEIQANTISELLSFTYDVSNLKINVAVSAIPSATVLQQCTVVVTDTMGNVFNQSLEIEIRVIHVNDFTVSGTENIVSKGTYKYTITDILPANHNKEIASLDIVASPSQNLVIAGKTTSAFNLVVTSMPDYTTDVTLTVVATLENNTTITRTKTVKIKVVSSLDILDEMGVAIMHKNGTFYTATEWTNEGFTNADANGVAVSDAKARTDSSSPTRIVVCGYGNFGTSASSEVLNYVFPDGTQSHIPTKVELKAITLVPSSASDGGSGVYRVNYYLRAIGRVELRTDSVIYDHYYSYKDINGVAINITNGIDSSDREASWIAVCTPRAVPSNKPVDLGLPSGRLWSNVNLGAASAENSGLYYQWGNLEGHDGQDGYDFSSTHYAETPGYQISANVLPLANDAANDTLGGYWRTPTKEDFDELFDNNNTTRTWVTINSISGWRITSKTNENSIFMPVTGCLTEGGLSGKDIYGYYWSSSKDTNYSNRSYYGYIYQNYASATNSQPDRYGQAIRPVLDPPALIGDDGARAGTHNYTIINLDNIASISASVSTPTAGSVAVTTSGLTTILDVTDTPNKDESVTLTVFATLTDGSTKTITRSVLILGAEYVDLGLPSGLLWCKHNLGGQLPTDSGLYFAWGETTGYADAAARNTALGRSDGFSSDAYKATGGAAIEDSVLTWAHDAAAQIMGGDWRMPTKGETQELYDNTDMEWVSNYNSTGVAGMKFMKKSDHSIYIFLPAAGYYEGTSLNYRSSYSYYWSASFYDDIYSYYLFFGSEMIKPKNYNVQYMGFSVRPVRMPTKAIDLGLPSGTLWADKNLGANSPKDAGLYFSWGNIEGHAADSGYNFDSGTYNSTSAASISANLSPSQDAAQVNLGGNWRMPTKEETQELYDNTDTERTTIDGVKGRKFMKKSDHSVYIFLPAAGYYNGTSLYNRGSFGFFWSASFNSSSGAYGLYFDSSSVGPQYGSGRYCGFSVRPVQ